MVRPKVFGGGTPRGGYLGLMHRVRATIERYVPLEDEAWARIEPMWTLKQHERGELVTAAGSVETRFGIMEEGVHRIFFEHDGQDHSLGFSYDGSWTGVYDSFVTGRPARIQLLSMTPSAAWWIDRADLLRAYEEVPAMERFGRLILEEVLVGRAQREIEMLSLSAEERYRRFMDRSAHLLQLVPQKDIASYLGMTPETFSRLRARVR